MPPIIETQGLNKRFGSHQALDRIDLRIEPGTIGLLGPNGAGKSTLIRCLLQLDEKDTGSASLLGQDIDVHGREVRKRVGYAPEQDCHIPGMAGCEYVTYCAQLSGLPFAAARQRAHEMLDFVGMGQERYRLVETYSTGMKQRIKIAQAIVHDPELVFLDEPTNGLDPEGQAHILDLIGRIWKESGISVVLSSHLLPDVDRICEQIVILARGRVVVHDRLQELKRRRKPVAELSVQGGVPELIEAFSRNGWPSELLSNGRIRVAHGQESLNPMIAFLGERRIAPIEIKASPNALQEFFLQAVRDQGATP
ncbi:MAG TPA: ABC transporter ATP-binding protein [Opitutaceae bacterium]|nr:ABC transporter ATP-binding protein [Opitutaceae bacterium]